MQKQKATPISERREGKETSKNQTTKWSSYRIGITGASGELGTALTKSFKEKGAYVIGLTHSPIKKKQPSKEDPNEWIAWECGKENLLDPILKGLDILVLNHGINPKGENSSEAIKLALEINALSTWKILERMESLCSNNNSISKKEVWVNTSEAEIQPALSPTYEISKRLIGQLISLKWVNIQKKKVSNLEIKKLILGPFRSRLNPAGIMSADFVANQIINQANLNLRLIIVTPNPITYLMMPITELSRYAYCRLINIIYSKV